MRLAATTPPTAVPGNTTQGDIAETNADVSAQDVLNDFAAIGVSPTQDAQQEDYRDAAGLVRSRKGPTPASPYAGPLAPSSKTSSSSSSSLLLYGGAAAAAALLIYYIARHR